MYANLLGNCRVFSTLGFRAPRLQPFGSSDRGTHRCRAAVRGLSTHCCHTFEFQYHDPGRTPTVPTSGQDRGVWSVHQASRSWLQTLHQRQGSMYQQDRRLSSPALLRAVLTGAGRNSHWCIWRTVLHTVRTQVG